MLSKADPRPPFRKPLMWQEAGEPAAPPMGAEGGREEGCPDVHRGQEDASEELPGGSGF